MKRAHQPRANPSSPATRTVDDLTNMAKLAASLVKTGNIAVDGHGMAVNDHAAAVTFAVVFTATLHLLHLLRVYATPEGEQIRERICVFMQPGKEAVAAAATHAARAAAAAQALALFSGLADLRVQVEEIIAAGLDATAPPSKRNLGLHAARQQILEAAEKCRAAFDLAGKDGAR